MNGVDFNTAVSRAVAELLSTAPQVATLLAILVAVPASLAILALYRSRILRSMRPKALTISGTAQDSASPVSDPARRPPIEWQQVTQAAIDHRAGLSRIYILGGIGLAGALAAANAIVSAGRAPVSRLQFILAAIFFSTPLALTLRLVYGRWKPGFAILAWQLAAILVLSALVPQGSLDQLAVAIVAVLMLAVLLHPRIRAMGTLATGFFTVVFTGALVSMAGSVLFLRDYVHANIVANPLTKQALDAFVEATNTRNDRQLQLAGDLVSSLLRAHGPLIFGTLAGVMFIGVLVSAVLGSLLFALITRSYARKRFSEQWLVIASIWVIVAVAVASALSPLGLPANLACLGAFALGVTAGWRRLPHHAGPDVRLLLLRSFTLGERSNRLFQDLESLWRSIGSIQLVGAPDIALTTLEPHELLDFLRGRTGREFVHRPPEVDARIASFDHRRDPDGRFRVNVIFCGGDAIWKYAVNRMLRTSDCVLMDLRGFSRHRAGCVFEIRCLAESQVRLRTVFLVDDTTDQGFISETWATAARDAAQGVDGDVFGFVPEQPLATVAERTLAAFSSRDADLSSTIHRGA